MIKTLGLIAFDLDGTVLNDYKKIDDVTKNILKKCGKNGIYTIPATGRELSSIPPFIMNNLDLNYAITSNGAKIYNLTTNKTIYSNEMSYSLIHHLLNTFLPLGANATFDVNINGKNYIDLNDYKKLGRILHSSAMYSEFKNNTNIVSDLGAYIMERKQNVEKFQILLSDSFQKNDFIKILNDYPELKISSSSSFNIELNNATANKGEALTHLANHLDIPMSSVLSFGDGFNDWEMLLKSGYSCAMGNSPSEIKTLCNYVTKNNNNNGIAYALSLLIPNLLF
ncbi:MAG: Cof-type HAD-IIB family hydrolase [Anaerostipes sp.]|nr:Cof-type HAD-IIB family hydrolase [Anaerostipes sp.]MDD3746692.1 Cof-type HAD-IIB family hydrolase [Anaerostipes sp.]